MVPAQSPQPHMEHMMCRLRKAGWIEGHAYHPGSGYRLGWTIAGKQRALLLLDLVRRLALTEAKAAARFSSICLGLTRVPAEGRMERRLREFWIAILEELGIGDDEAEVAALVRVVELKH